MLIATGARVNGHAIIDVPHGKYQLEANTELNGASFDLHFMFRSQGTPMFLPIH